MPDNDNDEDLTPEELEAKKAEAKAAQEAEIAAQLKSMDARLGSSETLAKIMNDPDIRAVLDARQAGRKVRLVEDKDELEDEPEVDLDALSNKQLAKYLLKQVVKASGEAAETRIGKMEQTLQGILTHIQGSATADVREKVESMKGRFADFDDLREMMTEINRETPGHSVEELYVLAKVRENGLDGLASGLRSERPSSSTARPSRKNQRKTPLPTGRKGFDVLLQEALEKGGPKSALAKLEAAEAGEESEEE